MSDPAALGQMDELRENIRHNIRGITLLQASNQQLLVQLGNLMASQSNISVGTVILDERRSKHYGKQLHLKVTGWKTFNGFSLYVYGLMQKLNMEWGRGTSSVVIKLPR